METATSSSSSSPPSSSSSSPFFWVSSLATAGSGCGGCCGGGCGGCCGSGWGWGGCCGGGCSGCCGSGGCCDSYGVSGGVVLRLWWYVVAVVVSCGCGGKLWLWW